MAKISMPEAIKLTAQYVGCSYKVAETIIKAYGYIVYKLLLEGYETKMPVLGKFYLTERKEQGTRQWKDPKTLEIVTLPPKPAYQKPAFKFSLPVVKEIREKTEGNLM